LFGALIGADDAGDLSALLAVENTDDRPDGALGHGPHEPARNAGGLEHTWMQRPAPELKADPRAPHLSAVLGSYSERDQPAPSLHEQDRGSRRLASRLCGAGAMVARDAALEPEQPVLGALSLASVTIDRDDPVTGFEDPRRGSSRQDIRNRRSRSGRTEGEPEQQQEGDEEVHPRTCHDHDDSLPDR